MQTAHSLATRFVPAIGCTQSWDAFPPPNGQSRVIADNLMNLELLLWAGNATGNTTLTAMATSHADRMITDLFQPQPPGCVWHVSVHGSNTADNAATGRSM